MYRKKKIAFTLIDEIVRLSVKSGVQQGCFTAERCVPSPITTIRFYHRPINYVKLQKYDFVDVESTNEKHPEKIQKTFDVDGSIPENCVEMGDVYIDEVYQLYSSYINKYNIYVNYSKDQLTHYLLKNPTIVRSYVYLNENNNVVDFFSYYNLNSIVTAKSTSVENPNDKIFAGYLFLYTCNEIATSDFMGNLLKVATSNKLDVFNVTDTMIISEVLFASDVKNDCDSDNNDGNDSYQFGFLKGTGKVHFNFFNWKCPKITTKQLSWTTF